SGIEENCVVEQDAAFLGTHEPGDHVKRKRLSRTAGAEQHRDARSRLEIEIQGEASGVRSRREAFPGSCLDHRGSSRFAKVRIPRATAEISSASVRASVLLPESLASLMARATVCVRPGMSPATISVAPNSPRDRAKASAVAARIERRASGRVTRQKS